MLITRYETGRKISKKKKKKNYGVWLYSIGAFNRFVDIGEKVKMRKKYRSKMPMTQAILNYS